MMRSWKVLASVILVLILSLGLSAWASAEVVGHITKVEGRVDLLKGGKLPATPAKLQDPVDSMDVLRAKSFSKAQITFIDNTIITLSPNSRLAVKEYEFHPAKKKRSAVLKIFQGLAHVVVSKMYKVEEPDFIIETNTAVTGVRGTDFGVRLQPNSSTILNFKGLVQVANIFPEVGQMSRRTGKVAYAFPPSSVLLHDMQATTVAQNLPPTVPVKITDWERKQFMGQLATGLMSRKKGESSGPGPVAEGGTRTIGTSAGPGAGSTKTGSGLPVTGGGLPVAVNPLPVTSGDSTETGGGGGDSITVGLPDTSLGSMVSSLPSSNIQLPTPISSPSIVSNVYTPTQPLPDNSTSGNNTSGNNSPPPPPPTSSSYSFIQTLQSAWTSPTNSPSYKTTSSTSWGVRTGVATSGAQALPASYCGYVTANGYGDRTLIAGALFGSGLPTGTSTSTLTATVTGVAGSTLVGTGTATGTSSFGETFSFTGTVSIDPSGALTFTYGGANGPATITSPSRLISATGTTTSVIGTYFTQTLEGLTSGTSSSPYASQNVTTVWGKAYDTSGLPSPYYLVDLTGSATVNWNFNYLPQSYDSLSGTVQGVISGQQGAATVIPPNQDPPFVSQLSAYGMQPSPYLFGTGANSINPIVTTISIDPSSGVLSGTAYYTDYLDGRYSSQVYNLTQTPQASLPTPPAISAYDFTETYNGAFVVNGGPLPVNTGATNSFGWGLRSGTVTGTLSPEQLNLLTSYFNGYFVSYGSGNWSGSLPTTSFYGSALVSGNGTNPGTTMLSGSVSGILGQNLTGNMTWIGSLLNGASFNYQGNVTIDGSGRLQFDYGGSNGSATWVYPGGASGTASGTLYQYPGYHFIQTMPGTYQLDTTSPNNGTLTLTGSSGTRSGVYGGSLGPYSGLFYLFSESGSLPQLSSGTLTPNLNLEGVVDTSWLGGNFGPASLTISTSPSALGVITVPGNVLLSPGNTVFQPAGAYVQSSAGPVQVYSSTTGPGTMPNTLSQLPLYNFSETYQGFRILTGSVPTLGSIEGYGWGTIAGTGTTPLPTSYTGNASTGYFVSQNLGTVASLSAMPQGWAGVTGSFTGSVSGTLGQTLTGQMAFNGTTSTGAAVNYQGNVTLASNGTLVWNYYGTWTAGANSGTASGEWIQVLGTYYAESLSGTYQQSTSGTIEATSLSGSRTVGSSTTSTTGSATATQSNPVSSPGNVTLNVEGVVANSTYDTKWGVASMTPSTSTSSGEPTTGNTISGPVTIDASGNLTGLFVDQAPGNNVTVNLNSQPDASGTMLAASAETAATTDSKDGASSQTLSQSATGGDSSQTVARVTVSSATITSDVPNAQTSVTGTASSTPVATPTAATVSAASNNNLASASDAGSSLTTISGSVPTRTARTRHSPQALVADYINHTAIADVGREPGEFAPTLTTASITATIDQGVVPGTTVAPQSGAGNIRTSTHSHRTTRVARHGAHRKGHLRGRHRRPLAGHRRTLSHRGLHHGADLHRGPRANHNRGPAPAPLTSTPRPVKAPQPPAAGPKLNLTQTAH